MSTNPTSATRTSKSTQSRPDVLRIVSLAIAGLVLAAALWIGVTSSRVATPTAVPATARPSIVATATPAGGAAAAAQSTPSADQSAAWYLQQETHEGDYCQCGNSH